MNSAPVYIEYKASDSFRNYSGFKSEKTTFTLWGKSNFSTIKILFRGKSIFDIPEKHAYLFNCFNKSTYILGLSAEFGEGVGFDYTEETLIKVFQFLVNTSDILHSSNYTLIPPSIYHGKEGGIDLIWESEDTYLAARFDKKVGLVDYFIESSSCSIDRIDTMSNNFRLFKDDIISNFVSNMSN